MTRFGKTIHDFADFYYEVAKGNVTGHKCVYKFGHDPDVDVLDGYQDLVLGGVYAGFNAVSALAVTVTSLDVNDTAAGTGAQSVIIEGLDANYEEISETVATTGGAATPTTGLFIRVNRAYIGAAGSGGTNAGIILLAHTTPTTMAQIEAGFGQTMQAAYTIPANKTAYLMQWAVSSNAAIGGLLTHVDARINVREFNTGSWRVREQYAMLSHGSTSQTHRYIIPCLIANAKADMKLTGQTTRDDTTIEGQFGVLLVDD